MSKKLKRYRRIVDDLIGKYQHVVEQVRDEQVSLERYETHVLEVTQAQQLVQQVAQTVQQEAHEKIASVVSRCLEAVFEDPYEFKIIFERKRGRTEARLVFVRQNHEVDPTTGAGGGAVDVASFALRLACLVLTLPRRRRLLVFDEPFKNVHGDMNRERLRQLLHTLAVEMEVQFVMSTGIDDFHTGRVIEIG